MVKGEKISLIWRKRFIIHSNSNLRKHYVNETIAHAKSSGLLNIENIVLDDLKITFRFFFSVIKIYNIFNLIKIKWEKRGCFIRHPCCIFYFWTTDLKMLNVIFPLKHSCCYDWSFYYKFWEPFVFHFAIILGYIFCHFLKVDSVYVKSCVINVSIWERNS